MKTGELIILWVGGLLMVYDITRHSCRARATTVTALIAASFVFLTGCVPATISGRINTAQYSDPPSERSFTVVARELSLTDRKIASLLEDKLTARGYQKAASPSHATVAVLFRYSLGSGSSVVSSMPDFVFGGQQVVSHIEYPRFFEIVIIDLQRSEIPNKVEIIWQGELRSSGTVSDMSLLSPVFVDALFEYYGKSVKNWRFSTIAPR